MKKFLIFCLFMMLGVMQTVNAGIDPVANLPDYNGTYYGTPNTGGYCDNLGVKCDSTAGRKMFTTLYRDNYERKEVNPCAGERCGKHPGVDIDVESGTPVIASLSGTAYRVESCNSSWGGLVVVEVNNPYKAGEKAYVSYVHLRAVYVSQGATITQGQTIGESGGEDGLNSDGTPNGKTPDPCRGTSTGSHLHFQIDRPHTGTYPWFPTGQVEQADTNFGVTVYTHNPLPFVLGYAYNFTFSENNNKELWGAANVIGYNTVNSDLWIDSSSVNPYVGRSVFFGDASGCGETAPCSREFTLDAGIFKRLALTLDFRCVANPIIIYFRGPDDVWHGGSFNYDSARQYVVNMGGLTYWNGIISDLIVQPSQGCTASPGPAEYFIKQMFLLP